MKNNSPNKEYLTIKKFASHVGMTIAALRHYEKTGIFLPAKHGEVFGNNYRYYAPFQIITAKMVRVLTEIGVPLKEIKELSNNRTPEKIYKLLYRNRDKVADEIMFLREIHSVINVYLDLIGEGLGITENTITVSETPERQIILGNENNFGDDEFYGEFLRFQNEYHEPKLNISYPVGGYWPSMAAFLEKPSRPERFFSLDPKGYEQCAGGLYLRGYTRGCYGETNDLPQRMSVYAKKNGLVFTGAVYYVYLFDGICLSDNGQYLLQVSAAVSETVSTPARRPRKTKRNLRQPMSL